MRRALAAVSVAALAAVLCLLRRRRQAAAPTLQLAAQYGDLKAVRAHLQAAPRLRPRRGNRLGSVQTAKPGVVPPADPSGAMPSRVEADDVATVRHEREAAEALAAATVAGNAGVVEVLLQAHADPNASHGDEQWSAYHLACVHDQPDCLEALVRAGCDEPRRDARGRTGAELAAEHGCQRVLDRLSGPLADLRERRLRAKTARRKVERGKRALLLLHAEMVSGDVYDLSYLFTVTQCFRPDSSSTV